MTGARTVGGVHTHTHTNSFREIRKGEKAFINDIKNSLSFLRAKKERGEKVKNGRREK